MRQPDETPTGMALRMLREEERENCAKIAERIGNDLKEYAVAAAIAKAIRRQSS